MQSAALMRFLLRLFHLRRVGSGFESPRYLLKWLFISIAIGLVAGVGALAFFEAIRLSTGFFLGKVVGSGESERGGALARLPGGRRGESRAGFARLVRATERCTQARQRAVEVGLHGRLRHFEYASDL